MEEKELQKTIEKVEEDYGKLQVVDSESYNLTALKVKDLSKIKKNVKDYWKEPIANAYKTHKTLKAKENEMTKPLEKAISYCKNQMSDYILIQENEKKRLEEENQANIDDEFGAAPMVQSDIPETSGISFTSTYKIDSVDINKIPKTLNGIQLLIADESAIKTLIKLSKGAIDIPGIKYHEEKTIRASGK